MTTRVLIADPDEALLDSYRAYLSRKSFEIATATTGRSCLFMLREFRPDVLVLEPDLPGDWGTKLLELMRNDRNVPCVPVVILTRNDHAADQFPVRQSYVKPLSMTRLVETIRQAAETAHA